MEKTIFWFRRDLRLEDNHGLFNSLTQSGNVLPLFIFDSNIIDELPEDDARVTFIHDQLKLIKDELNDGGSDLIVRYGDPEAVWSDLIGEMNIRAVYTNHDYEPYAIKRDEAVKELLHANGISFNTFKDHVIFEKKEILSKTGGVYTVFTPYKRRWLEQFNSEFLEQYNSNQSIFSSENYLDGCAKVDAEKMISLKELGFTRSKLNIPDKVVARGVVKNYGSTRNFPGNENSTTKLGIHFRFGTISIRKKAMKAAELSEVYLSELIWRDFYAQILANFPHVVEGAFRSQYGRVAWRDSKEDFERWKTGTTGYPMVDAGMRELNATGYMHNRVRMVTASFLTKHLLIDWRKGEAYFALKLLDFDLASNNGGWQWAAGSGTDAAPYFRIFNPASQMEKFDKDRIYIKKWVPEYGTDAYPDPMVDHKFARERCLAAYKSALYEE